jgi:TldD protein
MARASRSTAQVLVLGSDGTLAEDARPLVRLNVQVIAQVGRSARGRLPGLRRPQRFRRAARPARWQELVDEAGAQRAPELEGEPCPAGSMTVVLGPRLARACSCTKRSVTVSRATSTARRPPAFAGRIGERVARPGVTVVDDGTLPGPARLAQRRTTRARPTQRTVLIEDGILRGYLQDRLNARLMGHGARPATAAARAMRTCRCRA